MFSFRKPSVESIRRQLAAQGTLEFTYSPVGATSDVAFAAHPPASYVLDHTRVRLGAGQAIFHAAGQALREWRQFRLGWLEALPGDAPLATGAAVAVVARALGVWSFNCARIVYTIDDEIGTVCRFGFAYGTLPDHVEAGEERFVIEWDTHEGSVYYDVLAFSRPRHLLAKIGYPLVRRMQHRFGRESAGTMLRIVQNHELVTAGGIERPAAAN